MCVNIPNADLPDPGGTHTAVSLVPCCCPYRPVHHQATVEMFIGLLCSARFPTLRVCLCGENRGGSIVCVALCTVIFRRSQRGNNCSDDSLGLNSSLAISGRSQVFRVYDR